MISQHPSGLAVVAAPNRPAEMRSFDPDVVTRLLDLVSSHFDYVVFDMPRTWFSWTDSVLLGSNKLFIVSETTVPGLRQAKQLVDAIRERLGDGPQPQVIINRFEQKMFSAGLAPSDIEQAIGDSFLACIPNDYGLVREAIDRGVPLDEVKPGNKITAALKKLILPQPTASPPRSPPPPARNSSSPWRGRSATVPQVAAGLRTRYGRPFFSSPRCCSGPCAGGRRERCRRGRFVDGVSRGRSPSPPNLPRPPPPIRF